MKLTTITLIALAVLAVGAFAQEPPTESGLSSYAIFGGSYQSEHGFGNNVGAAVGLGKGFFWISRGDFGRESNLDLTDLAYFPPISKVFKVGVVGGAGFSMVPEAPDVADIDFVTYFTGSAGIILGVSTKSQSVGFYVGGKYREGGDSFGDGWEVASYLAFDLSQVWQ